MKSAIRIPHSEIGFTLVELLVVVAIIAVLLSLLAPAMDRAVYQAELAACAAGLRGGASGLAIYAANSNRRYPNRDALSQPPAFFQPGPRYDTRPMVRDYMSINGVFNDPLSKAVDYENDGGAHGYSARAVWFGWQYTGFRGMFRLGDRFEWQDPVGPVRRYNLLLSDLDYIQPAIQVFGSHPDHAPELLVQETYQNESAPRPGALGPVQLSTVPNTTKFVMSRWRRDDSGFRGLVNTNFASDDGSVERFDDVYSPPEPIDFVDGRLGSVPWNATGEAPRARCIVPKLN